MKTDIANLDRNSLFTKSKKGKKNTDLVFVTGFNTQYKEFEHILTKYWPILKEDRVLANILPKKPRVVYRRAPTLRDLVHNVINPPMLTQIFSDMRGFY